MNHLAKLLEILESGLLLKNCAWNNEDILDGRDNEAFDNVWVNHHRRIDAAKIPLTEEESLLIKNIREMAFKSVYRLTSSSELAAYVSDDFELIAYAIHHDYDSSWLNGLLHVYLNGGFPTNEITEFEVGLNEQLEM